MKEKFDQSKLSADQIHLGSKAHEDFKQGINPPSWVQDEDTWAKAKEAALKSYDLDDDAYWPVVVSIYEDMGGEIGGDESLSNEAWSAAALCNEAIDQDGWALIAPFGEWPKTRVYREGGHIREQKFLQVLDNEAADALLSKENSFFRRLKRAMVGIPVYRGHGDLNDIDPKALSNETQKIKLGTIDQVRKTSKGVEAHFVLDNEGADAVGAGYKYPSSFWYVVANGKRGEVILAKPVKLISVALTQYPNISGVESLANARSTEPAARVTKENDNQMKQILIGWLAAKGIVLANDASDTQILEAVQRQATEQAASVTALGNEKSSLSGKITALENEKAAEKKRADDNATALANETTVRKAERKGRAESTVDLAIARGKCSVAQRDAEISVLCNSKDEAEFTAAADKLLKSATKHRTTASDNSSAKALANDQDDGRAEYDRQFKDELQRNGQDPVKAHATVMKLPGLADKLRMKRAGC